MMIKSLPFFLITLFLNHTNAITFSVKNNCPFTVWAAAVPGGGQRLENDQTWEVNVPDQTLGRIWARTGCSFNETGRGRCQTGDCNELLKCENYGQSPVTAVRYRLNIFNDLDFLDVSLINGFNVPVKATPDTGHCGRPIQCSVDIKEFCPKQLRVPGGCSDPCNVFRMDKYCCGWGSAGRRSIRGFFRASARELILTLKMISQSSLVALQEPTIQSYFALEDCTSSLFNILYSTFCSAIFCELSSVV